MIILLGGCHRLEVKARPANLMTDDKYGRVYKNWYSTYVAKTLNFFLKLKSMLKSPSRMLQKRLQHTKFREVIRRTGKCGMKPLKNLSSLRVDFVSDFMSKHKLIFHETHLADELKKFGFVVKNIKLRFGHEPGHFHIMGIVGGLQPRDRRFFFI